MKTYLILFMLLVFGLASAQKKHVDFIKISATIIPDTLKREIVGDAFYTFLLNEEIDSIYIDAKNIEVFEFRLNGRKKTVFNDGKRIGFQAPKRTGEYEVQISYVARPKQALYFVGFDDNVAENGQIWTQGQGKFTSHWLPSFDDMNEKTEFDLEIIYYPNSTVIANGELLETKRVDDKVSWVFNMEKPMSSYLVAFAIGNYEKQDLVSESGIPIENYYYPTDVLKVEPTYRHTKRIFDFLENEIGVPYPWQNYKQIPVHDFLYAGMENTGTTIFSDAYFIDEKSYKDKNYVNVNAHELAHQWFGNLVTEESGSHHWLQEGFATYYAYLTEKLIFGEDDVYWKLNEVASTLKERADKGMGESLLDPNADSLTFYEKGAWALFILRDQVEEAAFKKGIISYLNTYSFKNSTVDNFLKEMEKASGKNLNSFKQEWLESTDFPYKKAFDYLRKHCSSLVQYDSIKASAINTETYYKDSIMTSFWDVSTSENLKSQFILDFNTKISDLKLTELLGSNDIKPRQSLAITRDPIFKTLKPLFVTMLKDDSYITMETALYKLWVEFPEDRIQYLNETKDIVGLPNKNIRTLWLALALVTPSYNLVKKSSYLKELNSYTSSAYHMEVRQNAFLYLSNLKILEGEALVNLIKSTNHHSWQFRNFTRNLLDEELKDEEQRQKIDSIALVLDSKDLQYLKKKLDKE
tara:strand:+ start:2201 stop:4285 length:2085 start_codon:yes stop_codon:yes gene_type:complete